MTQDSQRAVLDSLAELWALAPEIRLGQLMAHLGFLGDIHLNRGLGVVEDDELVSVIYRHRAELLARLPQSEFTNGMTGGVSNGEFASAR